jgi:Holliday junction DNA helicase RuvA
VISFVDGTIDAMGADWVVVNVGGVGFHVSVSTRTVTAVGRVGSRLVLQTCLFIRDEAPVLFGFSSMEERALFLDLISVSGVGPRAGLLLLGAFEPVELAAAIVRGDTTLLSHVPNVGKKTAARICVELASKMERYAGAGVQAGSAGDNEVVEALLALGYSLREATQAARSSAVAADMPLEQRITLALRALSER